MLIAKLNPCESCTIINFSALNRNASSWKISFLFNDLRSVFLFFLNWRCWILLFRKRKFPSGLTFQYWICQSWRVGWITVKFLFFHWISKLRYYALSLPICRSSYHYHDNRHIIILTSVGYFGRSDLEWGSRVLDHLHRSMIKWSYFWYASSPFILGGSVSIWWFLFIVVFASSTSLDGGWWSPLAKPQIFPQNALLCAEQTNTIRN